MKEELFFRAIFLLFSEHWELPWQALNTDRAGRMIMGSIIWALETWFSFSCLMRTLSPDNWQVSPFLGPWFPQWIKSLNKTVSRVSLNSYMWSFCLKDDSILSQNSSGNELRYSWLPTQQTKTALCLVPKRTLTLWPSTFRVRCLGQGYTLNSAPSFKLHSGHWVLGTAEFLAQMAKSFQKREFE